MKVIYRMSANQSTHEPPIHADDKLKLAKLCLLTFFEGLNDIHYDILFLLDNADKSYEYMIHSIYPGAEIRESSIGNEGTFLESLSIAKDIDDDVFLQEDDYIWKPNKGKDLLKAIQELEFISPYDHPDWYPFEQANLKIVNNIHWRTAPSTTLTFGARKGSVKEYYQTLTSAGMWDHPMWTRMKQVHDKSVWTPIPSFATHMVKDKLAPSVDWSALMLFDTLI